MVAVADVAPPGMAYVSALTRDIDHTYHHRLHALGNVAGQALSS